MEICLLSPPFQKINFTDIHLEYFSTYYAIRNKNLKRIKNLNLKKLSNISKQNVAILSLSGFIKENSNHKVTYYDLNEEKISNIPQFKVYGFTCFSCNYSIALRNARFLKEKYPEAIFILGGSHASSMDKEILKDGVFNIVVRGEGEITLTNILTLLEQGGDLSTLNGLTILKDKKIIRTPDEKRLSSEQLPFPDYGILGDNLELPTARIFTSRGCPFNCAFCSNLKNKVVYRSYEDISKEMNLLYTKFRTRLFYVGDENFIINEERALKIIDIFENFKEDACWIFQTRLDVLPERIIDRLKRCKKLVEINVGIENIDNSVLKLNNKKLTYEQIVMGLKKLKETEKQVMGYWIVGLPGETKETMSKNLEVMKDFLRKKLLYLMEIGCFVPYPGTDIYKDPGKYNISLISHKFDNYTGGILPSYSTKELSPQDMFDHYCKVLKEIIAVYKEINTGISFKKDSLKDFKLDLF